MACGIYLGSPLILTTDKVYIGQSKNIYSRVLRHNSMFTLGTHSEKMQKAYNEYGEFNWEVLKECSEAELNVFEKYYIKLFNASTEGFNTYEDSSGAPILYGLANGNVDKDNIPVYKSILDLTISNPTHSLSKIANLAGTLDHVVSHIWYGTTCHWLADLFPLEYNLVKTLQGNRQIGGKTAKQQGKTYPILLSPELREYDIENVRQFAKENNLDKGDLSRVMNKQMASSKGWILKDLNLLDISIHTKFYSNKRSPYKTQFDLHKRNTLWEQT